MDLVTGKKRHLDSIDNWFQDIKNINKVFKALPGNSPRKQQYHEQDQNKRPLDLLETTNKEDTWDLDVSKFGLPDYNIELEYSTFKPKQKKRETTQKIYQHKWGGSFLLTDNILSSKEVSVCNVSELEKIPKICYCLFNDGCYYMGKLIKRRIKRGVKPKKPYRFEYDDGYSENLHNLDNLIIIN